MNYPVSRKIIRQQGDLIVERTALGQVAEYDVYRVVGEDRDQDEFLGGGTKREALALFRKLSR